MRSMRLLAVAVLAVLLAMATIGPAHATVTTITASADTPILELSPNYIVGAGASLQVHSGSGVLSTRSLVKFDLSSIPSGSTICTASLQLYYYFYNSGGAYVDPVGRIYTANQVTTDWVEGSCNGCYPPPTGTGSGANWNKPNAPTSSDWGTHGGDFTLTGAASQTVPATTHVYVTWDVTTIVKAWIEDGQPNYGFLIKDLNEDTGAESAANFYPRDGASNVPILTVDFSPSGGCPVAVGGAVMPANTLALIAPWLAVIGLVGCISTVVLVRKKRRQ